MSRFEIDSNNARCLDFLQKDWRRGSGSNRRKRLCRPNQLFAINDLEKYHDFYHDFSNFCKKNLNSGVVSLAWFDLTATCGSSFVSDI